MHAAQLIGYLLLKCDSNDKVCVCVCVVCVLCVCVYSVCVFVCGYICYMGTGTYTVYMTHTYTMHTRYSVLSLLFLLTQLSVVINMFHEMSAVHSRLANTTLQCTLTQLLPDTPGDLTTLTRNVLALVQLPKSSAKQLQVR